MQKIFPKKKFSQNFLVNKGVLEKIINFAKLSKKEVVLEIGPGLGALTDELLKNAKFVVAVEKDKELFAFLKEKYLGVKNIRLMNADILKIDTSKIDELKDGYVVVANIPYNITSKILRKFLEQEKIKPKKLVLMVQKEIAQKIALSEKESILSLSVKFFAKPKILFYVSKGSFFPKPKVDSALLEIELLKKERKNRDLFFKLVKAGFSHPRKMLVKNIKEKLKLDISYQLLKIKKGADVRAEDLSLDDWLKIAKNLEK